MDNIYNTDLAKQIQQSGSETIKDMLDVLDRISTGKGICSSYEYDTAPTEKELATKLLTKIKNEIKNKTT